MVRSISMKIKTVNYSTSKPNGKPSLGYEYLGIDQYISFYELEDGDKT